LHSLPSELLSSWISILTIYQAVPIFFILIGRNYGASYLRRRYSTLGAIYSKDYFASNFNRIVLPFLLIFLISFLCGLFASEKNMYVGVMNLIGLMPVTGPGNYFITILLQCIFIFPIVFISYRKYPNITIFLSILLSFLFEIIAPHIQLLSNNSYLYKSCIFRYIFAIVLGLWLLGSDDSRSFFKRKLFLVGLSISLLYLLLFSLFKFRIQFFAPQWQPSIFISFFYPLFLCLIGMIWLPLIRQCKIMNAFSFIGKSSYHIFLVQILIFSCGRHYGLLRLIDPHLYHKPTLYFLGAMALLGNIIIAVILGLLFYSIDKDRQLSR